MFRAIIPPDGRDCPKPYAGGRTLKLSPEHLVIVVELVEANNDETLEELCEQLQHQSGITITRATMGRITQRLNLTVKKRLHATQRDSERVQQLPVEFWQQMRTIDVHNL